MPLPTEPLQLHDYCRTIGDRFSKLCGETIVEEQQWPFFVAYRILFLLR